MYLLYVDESGQAKGLKAGSSEYFVLAGVAVHEEDCYPLSQSLAKLQRQQLGATYASLELHASRIQTGREEWSRVDKAARHDLIDAVFDHLAEWRAPSNRAPVFFAAAVHKPSFRGRSVLELAHEEVFARFDSMLGRLHAQGDSHRSLVVADESSYESVIQRLAPSWKAGGRTGRLHGLIEVPLYVDSRASYLVQAADFVAWAVFNYYERGHVGPLQRIHQRFDSADGIQHGLAHMVKGYGSCECVPCASRRTQVVADVLPAHF